MADYHQFCPVALGSEVFAERWTPLILRELLAGATRFSVIHRGIPRISRNLLVQRLDFLQRTGIIAKQEARAGRGHEYHLTEAGRELGAVVEALGVWGYKWASKDIADEHLDPDFLIEVSADTEAMARVCLGHLPLVDAVKSGRVALTGAPRHRRQLCACLGVTHFAAAHHT